MLNMFGHITGMAAIIVNLVAIVSVVPMTLSQRLVAAGVAGAWVGLATALGAAGALAYSPSSLSLWSARCLRRRCWPPRLCGSARRASARR